ncbi:ribosome biogenesis protein [Candidatus Woesearchaeota archaeon]|jgi:H/ACA ribonucleoprotein complex subunit 3|nr:ribosome biogenesis protein [Candidatus Woesearchaeota archaeon]MBT5272562.1 ribosome biogenesis protein [Candidatus Woesearchaeota archaeon]MBT6040581.1 ribosome biogenesis protein [Candidatus Woesearchaeota archaeon]MBT6337114.1 ribosome biogenesis protein [Candidatus Woesearchaeota archaeon]MBT7926731.1 ribosome biogenesis protein [Candidatus Woesearchaeota archaeon]
MKHILKCPKCSKYTMGNECTVCKVPAIDLKPPKYSPEDKYGKYRREVKEESRKEKDLI